MVETHGGASWSPHGDQEKEEEGEAKKEGEAGRREELRQGIPFKADPQ